MAYQPKGAKPERPLDPKDPAVIEENRMKRDMAEASAKAEAEAARTAKIAAEDAEKIAARQRAKEAEEDAIRERETAETQRRQQEPLGPADQNELDALESEARSGRSCARAQMVKLSELRARAEYMKKSKK